MKQRFNQNKIPACKFPSWVLITWTYHTFFGTKKNRFNWM